MESPVSFVVAETVMQNIEDLPSPNYTALVRPFMKEVYFRQFWFAVIFFLGIVRCLHD